MKSVLLSIQPKWVELILMGGKTIEIRKSKPKIDLPFKCYIYSTQGHTNDLFNISQDTYNNRMKVVGEFTCSEILPIQVNENGSIQYYNYYSLEDSKVGYDAIADYIGYGRLGYGWKISNLIVYDKPIALSEFVSYGYLDIKYNSVWNPDLNDFRVTRPPQSYMFVEDMVELRAELRKQNQSTQTKIVTEYLDMIDPADRLNYYRNLHYKDPENTESYIIAWALDEILPELDKLRKEKFNG